ncbi:MAG: metallophosphoesterase [Sulfuricurvum sp.]|jgi:predicted phosphodiesterase
MKTLTISILSDLHFDSHFSTSAIGITESMVRNVFDPIFKTQADVLIIAGDLGHYNNQIRQTIKWFRKFYFKHIICVLGNHDYYLVNRIMIDDYETSFNRVTELRKQLSEIDGVHCLDGNVVEIEGVRFGGCDSWYDGQYLLHNLNPHYEHDLDYVNKSWPYWINDKANIYGVNRFDDIWEIERPKIEAVYQQCDVMITHIMPSINPAHVAEYFRDSRGTAYFCFDGEKYVKDTTAKIWVYGHTHTPNEFELHGVRVIANQLGYRGEARKSQVEEKIIEIEVKNERDD